jgi:hypothetical protein
VGATGIEEEEEEEEEEEIIIQSRYSYKILRLCVSHSHMPSWINFLI